MKRAALILILILPLLYSCKDKKDRSSILGSWNCEEYNEQAQPKIYQVNIERNYAYPDSINEYKIYNFYQLGVSEDNVVYVTEKEQGILTIVGCENFLIQLTGEGEIAEDYSTINWRYEVDGNNGKQLVFSSYY